ncbi:tetratricopeptide repeat protein [Thermomonas carbonis]|uniref:Tetratricopeptide repeat protein n=1 Tax=Thermomonas carbonis TaxID=1463158 RepID=A0A7G9SP79_9GAMM|nr:tetratricopeptide repeat protein [Thermomonas carbonis]QNN69654.1 tetratricopeptide repeat protein [Thermomonas carbonis]GHB94568.1 type IV pilus biogenesis/stability protein PilW [Thermomonas carbonis]
MRREAKVMLVAACVFASGCSQLERLTIVRPSAARGEYTKIASTYDVSGSSTRGRDTDVTQLLMSASHFYQAGDLAQSQGMAQRALKSDPRSGDAHTLLGAIADARGDGVAAGKHYGKAAEIAPKTGIYANNYGTWLCSNGRAAESLDWFDAAVADPAYPTRGMALANAGKCARQAGQPDRAEANWRQALTLEPGNVPALSGMAALQFSRHQYLEARAFTERWLTAAPVDADGLSLAIQVEQKLGDNAAASRYLSRLQAIPSGSGPAPRTQ